MFVQIDFLRFSCQRLTDMVGFDLSFFLLILTNGGIRSLRGGFLETR